MTNTKEVSSTAAPQLAGYLLQLERALFHLGTAPREAVIAVEHIDDVSVTRNGDVLLQEQDKHTVGDKALTNRSKGFWRTLEIWLDTCNAEDRQKYTKYILLSNVTFGFPIAEAIKQLIRGEVDENHVIQLLRKEGSTRSTSKVAATIKKVLQHDDKDIAWLLKRIEMVERNDSQADRSIIANGLAIDRRRDTEAIINELLGWLTTTLLAKWRAREPGQITRDACITQCREIESRQARLKFMPRSAGDVPVDARDREVALTRAFVHHLMRVDIDADEIVQAVDHFIQFNIEKHRLAMEGEVPDSEWSARTDRLTQRWKNICRMTKRKSHARSSEEQGLEILENTTYNYHEPLAGVPCQELYMTAGHYHRLADDDLVWWHPSYRPDNS